MVKKNVISIA